MVELLAPAGSKDALIAAIENGANAVYLAGNMFGARAYADNFDENAIREAIKFAHLRDAAVHVTVNTIVDDSEMDALKKYLRFLYDSGADAILVQDLGVASVAKKVVPYMPLHASTQMTVHNIEGVRAMEQLGFSRVVLSRELSIDEIKNICDNSNIEIEVFAHGALCVCYSGQCLMSSMIGGRSGNRGRCAQPCRLPYTLVGNENKNVLDGVAGQYLLSPRDLNTLDLLPDLIDAGVASLKIEGRMKRPEYVAVVTKTYRNVIDRYIDKKIKEISTSERDAISQIFNRDFTTAYLLGRPGRDFMSDARPNNRGMLAGRVVSYDNAKKRVAVKCVKSLSENDELEIWVKVGGRATLKVHDMMNESEKIITSSNVGDIVSLPLENVVNPHDRLFRVFDAKLMAEAKLSFQSGAPVRRIPVKVFALAHIGESFSVKFVSKDGFEASVDSGFIVEPAKNRPVNEDAIKKQLSRLGSTVYSVEAFEIALDENVMVPASVMNETRRRATELLDKARLKKYNRDDNDFFENRKIKQYDSGKLFDENHGTKSRDVARQTRRTDVIAAVESINDELIAFDAGADAVLFGGDSYHHRVFSTDDYISALKIARERGKKIYFNTPRIIRGDDMQSIYDLISSCGNDSPDAINVHNIGTLYAVKGRSSVPINCDFSLITYNIHTIEALSEIGVLRVTLSPEMNFSQIEAISRKSHVPLECIVHGRIELMVTAYCAMGTFIGRGESGKGVCCAPCTKDNYALSDRVGARFPLVTDGQCNMHVLNSKTLSMLPYANKFKEIGIDGIRIDARFLSENEQRKIIKAYRDILDMGINSDDVDKSYFEKIEGKDITRGHYFRGVS